MSEPVKVLPMAQLLRLAKEKEAREKAEHEISQSTGVPEYRSTPVVPQERFYKKANAVADQIDRTLTPSESKVFEQLIRLSVGFNKEVCRVRVSVLMERTGYTSDKTVRAALRSLELKGRIERLSARNSPLGDEYRILAYSGNTGVPEYRSTPAENTAVLGSKVTGQLNTSIKDQNTDDETFSEMVAIFRQTTLALTSKEPTVAEAEKWRELAEVLAAELRIAAGRTTISSVPAFMAEHLRRRLWKMDKRQAQVEGRELPDQIAVGSSSVPSGQICPDCSNSGWWYPDGPDKGVAKCKHTKLSVKQAEEV